MNVIIKAKKIKETPKAVLIEFKLYQGSNGTKLFNTESKWVPNSQIEFIDSTTVAISKWIFQKNFNFSFALWAV